MPDAAAIVEWYRGTGLRPFLEALPDTATQSRFIAEYREAISKEYEPRPNGHLLFPFRRLFLVAYAK